MKKPCEQWCGKSSCQDQGCENAKNYQTSALNPAAAWPFPKKREEPKGSEPKK